MTQRQRPPRAESTPAVAVRRGPTRRQLLIASLACPASLALPGFARAAAQSLKLAFVYSKRRATEARIAHMAHHDALTGLPNRFLLRERLEQVLNQARRGEP